MATDPAFWVARVDELEQLADHGGPAAAERLVELLRVHKRGENELVAQKLDEIEQGKVSPMHVELSLASELVCLANEALLWLGPPAREALLHAFATARPGAPERWWYLRTLSRMGDPALDPFFAALQEGDVVVEGIADPVQRFRHGHDLARAGRELATAGPDAVYAAVDHPHEAWRSEAASLLGRFNELRAIEALQRLLNDPSEAVRAHARHSLEWLERVRSQSAQAPAEGGATTGEQCAAEAPWAGGRPLPPHDVPEFEKILFALAHGLKLDRWRAADTLGQVGDPRAVEPLRRQLNDPEPQVRQAVKEALARLETG